MSTDPLARPARGGGEFVQSLARGLEVIVAFDAAHPELTLSAVARRTGLSRATARRFLHTLVSLGYVRSDGSLFTLTPRVLSLGYAYLSSVPLSEIAQPHLKDLSRDLAESTSASVLDGDDIVYIARVHTHRIMSVAIPIGTRFPAYATSMGRVLLAGLAEQALEEYLGRVDLLPLTPYTVTEPTELQAVLDQVREQGWARVDQELEHGLRSVAVPVSGPHGEVESAVNVSMRVGLDGSDPHPLENVLAALRETAARISGELSISSPPRAVPGKTEP